MNAQVAQSGARLSYVVVPIEGEVTRKVHRFKKGEGIVEENVRQPGGFLVYFPRGHVIRIRDKKELKHYRLDKKPKIINIEGLNDPNSPVGKLIAAQDAAGRTGAMREMEKAVIQLATAATGRTLMPEQVREVDEDNDDESKPLKVVVPQQRSSKKLAA